VREIIETSGDSASDFLGSRVTDYYRNAALEPCSDKDLVSDIFDVKEKSLTEKLRAIIDSLSPRKLWVFLHSDIVSWRMPATIPASRSVKPLPIAAFWHLIIPPPPAAAGC
jgi:hypothetical protein